MAESEFDKIVQKAKLAGIDLNVVMAEIDRRIESKQSTIARQIIDQVPQLKPDMEEIVRLVLQKIQTDNIQQIDIDTVVAKVVEKIPTTGEVEKKQILKDLSEQLVNYLKNYEANNEAMVNRLVENALMQEKELMLKAVQDEMNRRHDEYMEVAKGGKNGSGGGQLRTKWGEVPWDSVLQLAEKLVDKGKDPFAGIDQFLSVREKVLSLEPQGPNINTQVQASSASFLEGAKLMAKLKSAGASETKKFLSPPGGQSKTLVKSSGLHPAVKDL